MARSGGVHRPVAKNESIQIYIISIRNQTEFILKSNISGTKKIRFYFGKN